jgi:hypothetical protein
MPTTALALSNNQILIVGLNNNVKMEGDKLHRTVCHRARFKHMAFINLGIEKIKEFP